MPKNDPLPEGMSASERIDMHLDALGGWKAETLARVRALIREADPDVVEEWKWGIPVWSDAGIITTGETYKTVVKLTFAKGAGLADQSLFTSSLEGNVRRAIDIPEGGKLDAETFKALVQAAVALNRSTAKPKKR